MRDKKDLIGDPVDPATPVGYGPDEEDGGHPLIATVIGVIFLIIMTAGSSRETAGEGPDSQAEMLGYFIGWAGMATAMVWGTAYAITIKKASTAWKTVSLIVIA